MEDDEIIIGINPPKKETKKTKNNKKKDTSKSNQNQTSKNKAPSKKKRTNTTIKNNSRKKTVKVIGIIFLVMLLMIILLSSSLFNIKAIEVSGNKKLSNEKIISLSSLELYSHILKFNKSKIVENIKENAYIEKAKVTRIYPNTVSIEVEEREVRYMLQFADSYVYINNQGYMLEISNEKLPVPVLVGFTTDLSNIKTGNRVDVDDLKKLNTVIKIYDSAELNELSELITKIDISNSKDYSIELESKGKVVYLGECSDYSDLKTRMLYLKSILENLINSIKYNFEIKNLLRKFLLVSDNNCLVIPEEIIYSVKKAITRYNKNKLMKSDRINEVLVTFVKIHGFKEADIVINSCNIILNMNLNVLLKHIFNNLCFRFYVDLIKKKSYNLKDDLMFFVFKDFSNLIDNLEV